MTPDFHAAWQAVIHHPLFAIGITLAAYQVALAAYERTRWAMLQPVLIAMLMVIGILFALDIEVREYLDSEIKPHVADWFDAGRIPARELAKELPEHVRGVITLGTPFTGHPRGVAIGVFAGGHHAR